MRAHSSPVICLLFFSSTSSHKKTFVFLFFLQLSTQDSFLPPLSSSLLFPLFFSPVTVNLSCTLSSDLHYFTYFPPQTFSRSFFFGHPVALSPGRGPSPPPSLCLSFYLSRLVALSHLVLQASSLTLSLSLAEYFPSPPLPSLALFSTS